MLIHTHVGGIYCAVDLWRVSDAVVIYAEELLFKICPHLQFNL